MDERTLLRLLTQIVNRFLADVGTELITDTSRRTELSKRLAEVAWNGLILLMRQCLAAGKPMILDELGRFEKRTRDDNWKFVPASSLEHAYALNLPVEEGYHRLARRALICLGEAKDLLDGIGGDLDVPVSDKELEEFEVRRALFGDKRLVDTEKLSIGALKRIKEIEQRIKVIGESMLPTSMLEPSAAASTSADLNASTAEPARPVSPESAKSRRKARGTELP